MVGRLALVLAFLGGVAVAADGPTQIHFSWSREIPSTDRAWVLEVRAGDEVGKVYLRRAASAKRRFLFDLERDGDVHWSPSGKTLLIEDMHASNAYRILVFEVGTKARSPVVLDAATKVDIGDRPGATRTRLFYHPRFVRWSGGDQAIISVGMTTAPSVGGSARGECSGFRVNALTGVVLERFDEKALKVRYNAECQLYP